MAAAGAAASGGSLLSRILSIPKQHPFAFGVAFSGAKTSFADWLVQKYVEKREPENFDLEIIDSDGTMSAIIESNGSSPEGGAHSGRPLGRTASPGISNGGVRKGSEASGETEQQQQQRSEREREGNAL